MNKELFKRMAGLISAFAITASSVLPSAAQAVEIADTRTDYDNIVHVIVELYGDPILADAICDRIVHDSYSIVIDCKESMRKRKGVKENEA